MNVSWKYRYLRALAAFYWRLTANHVEIYTHLEPMYSSYDKLRIRNIDGKFDLIYFDEFIDKLLIKDRIFDVTLPFLVKRHILEDNNELESRISPLNDILFGNDNTNDTDNETETSNDDSESNRSRSVSSSNKKRKIPSRSRSRSKDKKRRKLRK